MRQSRNAIDLAVLKELVAGYGVQVLSLLLLIIQNLVLPILIGTEEFGRLSFMLASSALLYSFYDNGYNLLVMRKRDLGAAFMRCKTELFALAALGYLLVWFLAGGEDMLTPILVLPHAFMMTWYSYYLHLLLSERRMREAVLFSLVFVAIGFTLSLVFVSIGVPVVYAPVCSVILTFVVAQVMLSDMRLAMHFKRSLQPLRRRLRYRLRLFLKQALISICTIVDSLVVWGGVYVITQAFGYHEGAIYRVAMSVLALMTQTIPVFKPTFLRLSRRTQGFAQLTVISILVVLAFGAAQWVFVWVAGEWILEFFFQSIAADIFAILIALALLPAMKVIMELQTVLLDVYNDLSVLLVNIMGSIVVACATFLYHQGIEVLLAFYASFCLLNMVALFQVNQTRRSPRRDEDIEFG